MKGKVLIVLFSLALIFGMLAASCDNGNDPIDPYKTVAGKEAGEFAGEKPTEPDLPILTPAPGAADVYVDFVNNGTGAVGKDNVPDFANGAFIKMSRADADALVATTTETYINPVTGVKSVVSYAIAAVPGGLAVTGNFIQKTLTP
jgi:hypothetical protein